MSGNSHTWTPPITGQYSSSSSNDSATFSPDNPVFDTSRGWDVEVVPSISEKYTCVICMFLLREPLQTECGHRFCRPCITRWLRESDSRCPVDNQRLDEGQLFPDNFAKREILQLTVHCPNHKDGCDQIIILKQLQSHYQECSYTQVLCINGCSERMARGDLAEHLATLCTRRRLKCERCHQEMPADKEKDHGENCPEASMLCPNCQQSLIRSTLTSHMLSECPRAITKCQYNMLGCDFEGERQGLPDHEASVMPYHMSLINQTLMRFCILFGLQPHPGTSGPRHPSSLGFLPTENSMTGSGAASFPSYFRPGAQPSSNTLSTLQQLLSHVHGQASPGSSSPAHSLPVQTVSFTSEATCSSVTCTAEGLVHASLVDSLVPQPTALTEIRTEQRNNSPQTDEQTTSSTRTRVNETSFTSHPKASDFENNEEVPRLSMQELLSIKCQNDIQDESLARHDQQLMDISHQCEYHEKIIRDLKSKVKTLESTVQDFEGRNGNGVYVWKIKNYMKLRRDAEKGDVTAIHSGSFYSSFYGYKLCIRVNLNGVDSAKGTHLSLFIHFMQGEYDEMLDWPFSGKIVLTVMDQNPICEMRSHISETLMSKPNLAAFQKPTSNRNHKGFGYMEFLPLNVIDGSTYVRNDTLIIRAMVIPNP
ncbi:TNF receptor-associated factor 6-like isoform X2 [Mya arenaria]|nr:TNF receptor-associated factor 6-like isoform X2 [Mya arenaria]XP_052800378.1 TNF receptor-associated factor 6-like isoform X2 [Mya arenaria]XP_052800379.1 TNF receptor-associated factor 6-like isoform X2 [Mya arenaria]XP_052800380.1 TNF receptor-associated factor 6-like isoform X2 [Mya arenaria]